MVIIELENGKKIEIELDEKNAPGTTANFKSLVSKGFYDGLIFHRVIPGFMIQGRMPAGHRHGRSRLLGSRGEFSANGVNNPLKHVRGVISMARSQMKDSAGSQFFLMHADAPSLDGQYAAFGKVVSGMDAVDEIAATETGAADRPVVPQVMKRVTLTDDETVTEPQKAGGNSAQSFRDDY